MQVSQTIRVLESKKLLSRTRSSADTAAKRVEVTRAGLKSLRNAMPIAIEIQRKLFGELGQPGGVLLKTLLQAHRNMPEEADKPRLVL
jgi:DNA-binding MarR family transcriptional regulator